MYLNFCRYSINETKGMAMNIKPTTDLAANLSAAQQPKSLGKQSANINDESLEHMQYVKEQLSSTEKTLKEEKVTISKEALALFKQNTTQTPENKSTEESANDTLLTQIKEQIEAIKQQLSRIKHDKSESAIQQRKQLQLQLNTLNATFLDLLGKKLDLI